MNSETNILFVQWTNNFGGIEKISYQLQCELSKKKISSKVFILDYKDVGIKYNDQITQSFSNSLYKYLNILKIFIKNRTDLLYIQYAGTLVLLLGCLISKKKIIYHFHGTKFSNNFFDKLIFKIFSSKIRVLANSSYTKNVIASKLGIKTEIVTIIPNIIDIPINKCKKNLPKSKFNILFIGRLTKGKNIIKYLEIAELLKENSDYNFIILGDGPLKKDVLRIIKEKKLTNVKFMGNVNSPLKYYKISHLVLFFSEFESFGNVILESIITNTPILCKNLPVIEEFKLSEEFIIENMDLELIAKKIINIEKNYLHFFQEINRSRNYCIKYFDSNRIIDKTVRIINEL